MYACDGDSPFLIRGWHWIAAARTVAGGGDSVETFEIFEGLLEGHKAWLTLLFQKVLWIPFEGFNKAAEKGKMNTTFLGTRGLRRNRCRQPRKDRLGWVGGRPMLLRRRFLGRRRLLVLLFFLAGLLSCGASGQVSFIRGDANTDGKADLSDAVDSLLHLFCGKSVRCEAALDTDGDGALTLGDPLRLLGFLFSGGEAPVEPFPRCGRGSETALPCESFQPCGFSFSTITIAGFNIENLSSGKLADPKVSDVVSAIVQLYDLTAVQEIRDSEAAALLLEKVNTDPRRPYSVISSPDVGANERYALFFRKDRVSCTRAWVYSARRGDFLRLPFLASFSAGNFDFTLICIHANHIDTDKELAGLAAVLAELLAAGEVDPDIILVGDLNADCTAFNENDPDHPLRDPRFAWLIGNDYDTAVGASTCTRDRIIVAEPVKRYRYVPDSAGVFMFDDYFGLTAKEARSVSDHYPVFASFEVDLIDND